MLKVIVTLITENETLKLENEQLKTKLNIDSKMKLKEAHQEPSYRRSKEAVQISRLTKSALKPCYYCLQVHRYGISLCKAYGAVCSYCRRENHVEEACFFKYPHLRKFGNTRSKKVSGSKKAADTLSAFKSIGSRIHTSIDIESKSEAVEVNGESTSDTDSKSCKFSRNCYDYKERSEKKYGKKRFCKSKRKISERMKLNEDTKHTKSVQSNHNQKEKNNNSNMKTLAEQKAECMKILGLTIDPTLEKRKIQIPNQTGKDVISELRNRRIKYRLY